MRTVLNIIWLLFGGIWLALAYMLAGVIACVFVITAPIGVASFRMARYALWPFGKTVVRAPGAGGVSAVANFVWFLIAGWWLALAHVLTALAQAISIIGLVNAVVSLKMIPVSCFPFGKRIVDA